MVVERIVKKDDNTVIVYLDNSEKLFLSYEVVLKNGLRKGTEISEDRFELIVGQNKKFHIRQKALYYLARRNHSKRELETKLKKKFYNNYLIKEVLDDLDEKNIIDDENFAIHFADEKINRKKWGVLKVKNELMNRGVNSGIIDEVLKKYKKSESLFYNALYLAEKKLNLISQREDDLKKVKQKVLALLMARGFGYELSVDVINKLIQDDNNYE